MPTDHAPGAAAPHPTSPEAYAGTPFPYLRWAKDWLGPGGLNLGLSGLAALDDASREALGLSLPLQVGDARAALKEALASRHGLAPEQVHPAAGTSHANFVVFFGLAQGAHVVVEEPAYEALPCLARAVGASVSTAPRDPERGWRFDAAALERAVRPGTRLIAVSDLHNPSGARLHPEDLDLLVATAERAGAWLLVDEVYLDFDPQQRPTAARRGGRVLATASLTKAHGLPDLRAGWILGDAPTIARLDAVDDLVHPSLPPAPMADAARYLAGADACLRATRARAAERAAQVDAWVRRTPGVTWTLPDGGLTGLLRFAPGIDGDRLAERLGEHRGVRVVPGSFFQVRHAVRVSFLLEPATLERALEAIAGELESLR